MVFRTTPENNQAQVSLGGNRVPGYAQVSVALDTQPGDYQLRITVKDLANGKAQSLTGNVKGAAPRPDPPGYQPSTGHTGGIMAGMFDGSVRLVAQGVSLTTWWSVITPQNGDIQGPDW